MSEEYDPWALSDGLVAAYRGKKVLDAHFGYGDEGPSANQCFLKLEVLTDSDELPEGIAHERYTVGKGYEPGDSKGQSVQREDGKAAHFNRNSGVGLLIRALQGLGVDMRTLGSSPFSADTWRNLPSDMEWERLSGFGEEKFEFKNDAGEVVKYQRMLPVALNGGTRVTQAVESDAGSESVTNTTATTDGGLSKVLRAKLKKLARESADFDSFVEAAFAMEGVDGNPAAEDAVTEGGLWEEAQAQ